MTYLEAKRIKDKENHRRWRAKNPDKTRANGRKAARKLKKLPIPTRAEPQMCECCGKPFGTGAWKGPHLDHDHITGKFRGWICNKCNRGIGNLEDSLEGLLKAVDYVRRNL